METGFELTIHISTYFIFFNSIAHTLSHTHTHKAKHFFPSFNSSKMKFIDNHLTTFSVSTAAHCHFLKYRKRSKAIIIWLNADPKISIEFRRVWRKSEVILFVFFLESHTKWKKKESSRVSALIEVVVWMVRVSVEESWKTLERCSDCHLQNSGVLALFVC